MPDFLTLQSSTANPSFVTASFSILLAFVLSCIVAWSYVRTFVGLSYSRGYVQALMLAPIVSATIMLAIGDSLARGLGMIGALAIIRFRTNFKDSRDTIFIFASLAAGIACGVGAYVPAIVGSIVYVAASFLLYFSSMAKESYFDGMLRFNMESAPENSALLEGLLKKHCRYFVLITLRDMAQEKRLEYAYHIKFRKEAARVVLLKELSETIPGIKGLNIMMQEHTVEL